MLTGLECCQIAFAASGLENKTRLSPQGELGTKQGFHLRQESINTDAAA